MRFFANSNNLVEQVLSNQENIEKILERLKTIEESGVGQNNVYSQAIKTITLTNETKTTILNQISNLKSQNLIPFCAKFNKSIDSQDIMSMYYKIVGYDSTLTTTPTFTLNEIDTQYQMGTINFFYLTPWVIDLSVGGSGIAFRRTVTNPTLTPTIIKGLGDITQTILFSNFDDNDNNVHGNVTVITDTTHDTVNDSSTLEVRTQTTVGTLYNSQTEQPVQFFSVVIYYLDPTATEEFDSLLQSLGERVDNLEGDVENLQTDVGNLQTDVENLQTNKQDKLIAGTNISIDENNVISAQGGGTDPTLVERVDNLETQTSALDEWCSDLDGRVTTLEESGGGSSEPQYSDELQEFEGHYSLQNLAQFNNMYDDISLFITDIHNKDIKIETINFYFTDNQGTQKYAPMIGTKLHIDSSNTTIAQISGSEQTPSYDSNSLIGKGINSNISEDPDIFANAEVDLQGKIVYGGISTMPDNGASQIGDLSLSMRTSNEIAQGRKDINIAFRQNGVMYLSEMYGTLYSEILNYYCQYEASATLENGTISIHCETGNESISDPTEIVVQIYYYEKI